MDTDLEQNWASAAVHDCIYVIHSPIMKYMVKTSSLDILLTIFGLNYTEWFLYELKAISDRADSILSCQREIIDFQRVCSKVKIVANFNLQLKKATSPDDQLLSCIDQGLNPQPLYK